MIVELNKALGPSIDPSRKSKFLTELSELVAGAHAIWRRAQYRTVRTEATLSDEQVEEWQWHTMDDAHNGGDRSSPEVERMPRPQGQVVRVLFPRIFEVRPDEDFLVFGGVALWKSQTTEAAHELEEERRKRRLERSPTLGKTVSKKEKKVRSDSSASMPSSPDGARVDQSFLDHGEGSKGGSGNG